MSALDALKAKFADMYNKQAKNYLADTSVQEQGIWS